MAKLIACIIFSDMFNFVSFLWSDTYIAYILNLDHKLSTLKVEARNANIFNVPPWTSAHISHCMAAAYNRLLLICGQYKTLLDLFLYYSKSQRLVGTISCDSAFSNINIYPRFIVPTTPVYLLHVRSVRGCEAQL